MKRKFNPKQKIRNLPFYSIAKVMQRSFMIAIGAFITAAGYSLFQVPYHIAAGGVSGLGIIINHFTGWNEGTLYLLMNIPLMILGFIYLDRWRFLIYTLIAVLSFSIGVNITLRMIDYFFRDSPITEDMLLSALYAGIVFGIGNGIIHKFGGTIGGTSIIGRIIQKKTGFPLSQSYLYSDATIVLLAGAVFGWENALHAMITLFVMGLASDYAVEGPSFVRMAVIITNKPEEVSQALMYGLKQGASQWEIKGSYTSENRYMIYSVIYRSQVSELKKVIAQVDENSFIVIGNAHQALGGGFMSLAKEVNKT